MRKYVTIFSALAILLMMLGAAPTTVPSTRSDASDNPDAKRLTFLGDQLTADEAAIDAINKALLQQGYKVAVANDKASDAAEGNQLMDRKGGAPVRWQDFYGRTAKDFIMHDKDSPVYYQVQRPTQFDYVYHANDTQIEAAKAEADSVGKKVEDLLAQRAKLEAEQSALWAKIAFESIGNRDIPLRPLYRDQLQADPARSDDNHPEPPTINALAAGVLYLRTANAATTLEEKLDSDQGACYIGLRDALNASLKSLQDSEANFEDAAGADPAQIKQMSSVVANAKSIVSMCTNLSEAYGKAQDAEQANEDARRQLYRGTVQQSLFGFSEAVGRFDDQLEQLSASWNVIPKRGTLSKDKAPDITITPSPAAPTAPAATLVKSSVAATPAADSESQSQQQSQSSPQVKPTKGTLYFMFKTGTSAQNVTATVALNVNGRPVEGAQQVNLGLFKVALPLSPGDVMVFRVSSGYANRGLRFAYIGTDGGEVFGSHVIDTTIRHVSRSDPLPTGQGDDPHPQNAQHDARQEQEWAASRLPEDPQWMNPPEMNQLYDMVYVVPKADVNNQASAPNQSRTVATPGGGAISPTGNAPVQSGRGLHRRSNGIQ